MDEVFGAGDAAFQAKAKERMEGLIKSVGIFVFASHVDKLVQQYCNRFFRLEHGSLSEIGREDF